MDETLAALLKQEDTDQNMQITIEDLGPKVRWMVSNTKGPLLIDVGDLGRNSSVIWT